MSSATSSMQETQPATPPVRLYTTRICPYCIRAKMLLNKRNIAFDEVDVSSNGELRRWLVEVTGGLRTVPAIFIHGQPIGGCDELVALDRAGKLMPMIEAGPARTR